MIQLFPNSVSSQKVLQLERPTPTKNITRVLVRNKSLNKIWDTIIDNSQQFYNIFTSIYYLICEPTSIRKSLWTPSVGAKRFS